MTQEQINQILPYFEQYSEGTYKSYFLNKEMSCKKYVHKEHDNFKICIIEEDESMEVYQLNTDHEIWGIELQTIEDLKIRFKSFTGYKIEDIVDYEERITDQGIEIPSDQIIHNN